MTQLDSKEVPFTLVIKWGFLLPSNSHVTGKCDGYVMSPHMSSHPWDFKATKTSSGQALMYLYLALPLAST